MQTLTLTRTANDGTGVYGELDIPRYDRDAYSLGTIENADTLIPDGTYPAPHHLVTAFRQKPAAHRQRSRPRRHPHPPRHQTLSLHRLRPCFTLRTLRDRGIY